MVYSLKNTRKSNIWNTQRAVSSQTLQGSPNWLEAEAVNGHISMKAGIQKLSSSLQWFLPKSGSFVFSSWSPTRKLSNTQYYKSNHQADSQSWLDHSWPGFQNANKGLRILACLALWKMNSDTFCNVKGISFNFLYGTSINYSYSYGSRDSFEVRTLELWRNYKPITIFFVCSIRDLLSPNWKVVVVIFSFYKDF